MSKLLRILRRLSNAAPAGPALLSWSDPATWGGSLPQAGDALVIPAGMNVLLDTDTPSLASLEVMGGELVVDPARNVSITAGHIMVSGAGAKLNVGTVGSPYQRRCTITLTGAEQGRSARFVADVTSGNTGAGDGRLTRLFARAGAVAEIVTVTFTSATEFTVAGAVSGALGAGTVGAVFDNRVRFLAVAGATPWAVGATRKIEVRKLGFNNTGTPRSLQVMGGAELNLIGTPPTHHRARIDGHIASGATSFLLDRDVDWQPGDLIGIGGTDYADTPSGVPLKRTIQNIEGRTVTVTQAITGSRWGVLQYATDADLSLTPGTLTKPADFGQAEWDAIPKVLDERAMVVHLSRNIVIQSIADENWLNNKFGAHCMAMDKVSAGRFKAVEFRRVGQAGVIGRYPMHWHMLSYNMPDGMGLPTDGTFTGEADPLRHFMTDCAIHDSGQRVVSVHGTHGVMVARNVAYDILGHAFFLEDAAEENNYLIDNVAMAVTAPSSANTVILSDRMDSAAATAGFWISNPNNTVKGNWANGCRTGFWNPWAAQQAFGLCGEVNVKPINRPVLLNEENEASCNWVKGFVTEFPPVNNFHDTSPEMYQPIGGADIVGNVMWKNKQGGYTNRVDPPVEYQRWTAADNEAIAFSGQAGRGVKNRSPLVIGTSLNNATNRYQATRASAFVSYDEGLQTLAVLAYNWPVYAPPEADFSANKYGNTTNGQQGSGLFRLGEYIFAIWTFEYYSRFKRINTDWGYLIKPTNVDGIETNGKNTLGIVRDIDGKFTGTPGRHIVFDYPFYTYGAADLLDWDHVGAKHTATKYIGVHPAGAQPLDFVTDSYDAIYGSKSPMNVDRLDNDGNVVGSWNCVDARTAGYDGGLNHFRHFGAAVGGIYRLNYGPELPTNEVFLRITLGREAGDMFTMAVAWDGSVPVGQVHLNNVHSSYGATLFAAPDGRTYDNVGMTGWTDVRDDTTGTKYWQDTANNLVWFKYKGGLRDRYGSSPDTFALYQGNSFWIRAV